MTRSQPTEKWARWTVAASVMIIICLVYGHPTHALLVDFDGDQFRDDTTDLWWYTHIDDFSGQTWLDAKIAVEALTQSGRKWRLASRDEVATLNAYHVTNEILSTNYMAQTLPPSTGGWTATPAGGGKYWAALVTNPDPEVFSYSAESATATHPLIGAFAVAGPIPEPSTLALLAIGLVGAGLLKRGRKKRKIGIHHGCAP